MRGFVDIQQALGLKKFLDSPLGTLHFVPSVSDAPRLMVRHFDRDLPVALVEPFAALTRGAQNWIEHAAMDRLVRIEQPVEVGLDFIARKHHIYYTSTDAYVDWERPPEQPGELARIRAAFVASIGQSGSRNALVEAVLARSLLEPTGKAFFDETEDRLVIVELKPTREELEQWVVASRSEQHDQ